MTKELCLFTMNPEQIIRFKENRQLQVNTTYLKLLDKERELKNVENKLWLNTDFKANGCTNDTMRRAFVSNETHKLRFDVDQLKQHESDLIIIDDLLALRMKEGES